MLIAVLFIIAPNWEQTIWFGSSTGNGYGNWYTHTVEEYSAIKRNRLQINRTTSVNLKCITLSEGNQPQKV